MSKADRRKKRERFAKPSAPRVIGANDNIAVANDNMAPVSIRGVTLTERQTRRYHTALRNLDHPNLEVQRAGHVAIETLHREIDVRQDDDHASAGIEERRGLEALRGVTIGKSKVEGAIGAPRLHHDGLETLMSAGAISASQHAAGMLYRVDYERIDPEKKGLTPPQLDPEKINSSHGGDNWETKRREIERRVFGIHLMICGIEQRPGQRGAMPALPKGHPAMRAIFALDEVAGKGRIISYLSESGSVRARIRDDLIFALDACEIVYGVG